MPMEKMFTRFVFFRDLKNICPDIYSDAFGIESFTDMLLTSVEANCQGPDEKVIIDLFDKIKNDAKVH